MLRPIGAMALLALSTAALAQTAGVVAGTSPATMVDKAATAPAPTPASTAAAINAKLTAPLPADQAAMKAHVLFLASDAMKGREAGSPEFDIAAQYVAAQFYAAGLKPGGDEGGYLQRVPMVTYKAAGKGSAALVRGGKASPLVFGIDYVPFANPAFAQVKESAPVVFAGWGIDAPEAGIDSYAGVDVRGKIVALFGGAPAKLDGELRAFFASAATKAAMALKRGAVGVVMLDNPKSPRPFARLAEFYDAPRMTWATADGKGGIPVPTAPILASLSQSGAAKLFAGAPTPWATIVTQAADANAMYRAMALPTTLSAESTVAFEPAASSNVIGMIPGSDPKVGKEVVILSAHLDHIGVSPARPGDKPDRDRINNGALDNAIGIASLIEEAKRFTTSGEKPKRTLMFLAVTGEEKGLVGSDYFTHHPTVPLKTIVADVNLDMPILTYKFEDMIVYGAERSTLGPIVRKAVNAAGVDLSPDPMPEEGIFVRSDHFRFVQQGIPAVFLWPGQKGPGKAAVAEFMGKCYHRPCDELSNLAIDWSQGPRFVDVNYRIAREIADGPARPVWNRHDYFGTLYAGPMAK